MSEAPKLYRPVHSRFSKLSEKRIQMCLFKGSESSETAEIQGLSIFAAAQIFSKKNVKLG